jgi:hypothetical protein
VSGRPIILGRIDQQVIRIDAPIHFLTEAGHCLCPGGMELPRLIVTGIREYVTCSTCRGLLLAEALRPFREANEKYLESVARMCAQVIGQKTRSDNPPEDEPRKINFREFF